MNFRQLTEKQSENIGGKLEKIEDSLELILKQQSQFTSQLNKLSTDFDAQVKVLEAQIAAQTALINTLSGELAPTVPVGQKIVLGKPVSQ